MTDLREVDCLRAVLAGRYTVKDEIGRGGMATVYLAEDLKHDRLVAIKVLRPDLASRLGPARFIREISIEAQLQHPNILPLYDSGESDDLLYYVMPYVEGETLRQRLEREKQLPIDEALGITREVAAAIGCAHGHGIVHRDIKPENILLSDERVIVADFGIARAVSEAGGDRVTETGHSVGTPAYMSPEQAAGSADLDARSDIYSLACVLYEMLAGEPPFTGRTAQAVIARHIAERPPSLEVVRPSVPASVATAIEKSLAKTPADRFARAVDFVAALEAPTKRGVSHLPYQAVRSRWVVAAGLLALAAGTMVVVLRGTGADSLDPHKVVVFPLVERNLDAREAGGGWGVAIAIGTALEHSQPLKWIDGWSRLPEPIRSNSLLLTAEVARTVSRDRLARFYIDGVVSHDQGSAAVVLRLYDAHGDSLIAQETAVGEAASVTFAGLGLRAVGRLLPKLLDPGRPFDLSALAERDPGAVALWLQGEREYRQSRFLSALEFYERAVQHDSLLALAAVKGAQAANWRGRWDEMERLIGVAVAHDSLLPPKYAHLARGYQAYLAGQADAALSRFRAALADDPEWSEPAIMVAETYYHLFPSEAALDSLAEVGFLNALALDTTFTMPLIHLAEIALRRGDVDRAAELIEWFRSVDPDTVWLRRLSLMLRCVRNGASRVAWDEAVRQDHESVLLVSDDLAVAGAQAECAERGFRAILASAEANRGSKWGALEGLQGLLLAQGRQDEALALLDSALAAGERNVYRLYIFNTLAGAPMETRAAEAEELARVYGEAYAGTDSEARWLLGTWHAYFGSVEKAQRVADSLSEQAAHTGDAADRLLAEAVAAHAALARGDTADAVSGLRALTPRFSRGVFAWDLGRSLAIERLQLAKVLLARGEYEEAYAVATVFDHQEPIAFLSCLRPSLYVRLSAARALNNRDLSARYEERLAALGTAAINGSEP